jgi:hypothetical protein
MSIGIIDGLDHGLFYLESRRLALDDLVGFAETLPPAVSHAKDRRTLQSVEVPLRAAEAR